MQHVYILTTYEAGGYSYSNVEPYERFIHSTLMGAERHAKELGLTIVRNDGFEPIPRKECTIDMEELLP